ncbi:MAG: c-type cytochrome, partial [Alphaproteobacteria bacterium]
PPTAEAKPAAAGAAMGGDPAAGEAVFKSHLCFACHKFEPGKNGAGPSLAGVYGRAAGGSEGFAYSDALKGSGIVWTDDSLDKWVEGPKNVVAGTKMVLAKPVTDAKDRADLIAYIKKASGS